MTKEQQKQSIRLLEKTIKNCNFWVKDDYHFEGGFEQCPFCGKIDGYHQDDCLYILIEEFLKGIK